MSKKSTQKARLLFQHTDNLLALTIAANRMYANNRHSNPYEIRNAILLSKMKGQRTSF